MVDGDFSFKFKLPNTGFYLSGYSRDKSGTGLFIDDLNLALDCGTLKGNSIPRHIFLTGNDIEVSLYAPMMVHLAALNSSKEKIVFHVPETFAGLLDRMINKAITLSTIDDLSDNAYNWEINPIRHGTTVRLDEDYFAQAFETNRNSVGYAFYGHCRRLRNEYSGFGFKDVKDQRPEDVTEKIAYPLFVYTGAVAQSVFKKPAVESFLKQFKNIIIECPCISQEKAGPNKTSLEALMPIIESSPDTVFILTRMEHSKTYEELKQIQLDSPPNVLFAMSQKYETYHKAPAPKK